MYRLDVRPKKTRKSPTAEGKVVANTCHVSLASEINIAARLRKKSSTTRVVAVSGGYCLADLLVLPSRSYAFTARTSTVGGQYVTSSSVLLRCVPILVSSPWRSPLLVLCILDVAHLKAKELCANHRSCATPSKIRVVNSLIRKRPPLVDRLPTELLLRVRYPSSAL
ncbi:hypothetical protein M404DRAFT_1004733 [Pisolithus tinctorius Marx 270]|uniref:Uncharacterized protein n=1 Tax=Pisolithus tinctorius Marx 270 TaxID=870435 RepID=A0A0C3NVP4_PISTI|nr:hypothetical protein M404DRAFT_1004733 [Pisolithus tinctorius Marx 270]